MVANLAHLTEEQLEALIGAARANVNRGHFRELYEGFNDCPVYEYQGASLSASINLSKCDCGYREAAVALRLLGEEVDDG